MPSMMPMPFAGGGMNAEAIKATSAETQKLVDAAKSGSFTIEPGAVTDMLKSIQTMRDNLENQMVLNFALAQRPQLGSHEYGSAVADHDLKGAAEEAGSANVVLKQFDEVLMHAAEALQRAAGIYDESEAAAQSSVTNQQ